MRGLSTCHLSCSNRVDNIWWIAALVHFFFPHAPIQPYCQPYTHKNKQYYQADLADSMLLNLPVVVMGNLGHENFAQLMFQSFPVEREQGFIFIFFP